MTGFDSKRDAAADKVQEVRGFLASQLKCWHRLTGEESDELVALFEAQPAQEPVAWRWGIKKLNGGYEWRYSLNKTQDDSIPLFVAPPQRQWIWLSDADIAEVVDTTCQYSGGYEEYLIKKAERKIKEKNG